MGTLNEESEIFRAQLSSRMRMVRKASDATQDEAAEICDVSPRSYKDYELGRRGMPVEVLVKFCENFRISTEEMLFGKRAAKPSGGEGEALVEEIATGVLSVFGSTEDDSEKDRQIKMACYAWKSAQAKGRPFVDELREISALVV